MGLKSFFCGLDYRYILDMSDKADSYIEVFLVESVAYCSDVNPHRSLNGYPKLMNYFSINTDIPFMDR